MLKLIWHIIASAKLAYLCNKAVHQDANVPIELMAEYCFLMQSFLPNNVPKMYFLLL